MINRNPGVPAAAAAAIAAPTPPFRLRTDPFAVPVTIENDARLRAVSAIALDVWSNQNSGHAGGGRGSIVFERNVLRFDGFGDASVAQVRPAAPVSVTLRPVRIPPQTRFQTNASPVAPARLFEIVLAGTSVLARRLYLAYSTNTAARPHRLLVLRHGDRLAFDADHFVPAYIFDLYGSGGEGGPAAGVAALLDAPQGNNIHLEALYFVTGPAAADPKMRSRPARRIRLSVTGTVGSRADLELDPNYLSFDAFGEIALTTAMASFPIAARLRPVAVSDPRRRGRRLVEIVPQQALRERFLLVLAPNQAGPHRLVVREPGANGAVRQVAPLRDPRRAAHAALQPRLARTSAPEQQAIGVLRRAASYDFTFDVAPAPNPGVIALRAVGGSFGPALNSARQNVLGNLTNLRTLEMGEVRLSATALAHLGRLARLEYLDMRGVRFDEADFASLTRLTRLRALTLRDCDVSDRVLSYVARLPRLEALHLEASGRGDGGPRGRITDAGLTHLRGLSRLHNLFLSGAGISDAGLLPLKSLTRLEYLQFYQTRVTARGEAALRSALPRLRSLQITW